MFKFQCGVSWTDYCSCGDTCKTNTEEFISVGRRGWNERGMIIELDHRGPSGLETLIAGERRWGRYALVFVFVLVTLGGASSLSMCLNLQQLEAASQVSSCRIKLPIFYNCCCGSTPTELRDKVSKRKGEHENRGRKSRERESHDGCFCFIFVLRKFLSFQVAVELECMCMCRYACVSLGTYFRLKTIKSGTLKTLGVFSVKLGLALGKPWLRRG